MQQQIKGGSVAVPHQFSEKAFIADIRSKFTQVEQIIDLVCAVVEKEKKGGKPPYMLWYGKGGFGKTEISKVVAKHVTGSPAGVMALHEDTTVSDLLGGIDMKVLMSEGEVRARIEKSVFMSKFFVLEEGLQAPTGVLNSLKFLLLEGIHCSENACVLLESRHGLIATNFDPKKWATTGENDDDALAFLERFPFQLKVEWEDYSAKAYLEALSKRYPGKEFEAAIHAVAMFAGHIAANGTRLSPRTIIGDFAPMYFTNPVQAIKYTAGIPPAMREYMANEQRNMSENAKTSVMCDQVMRFTAIDISKYKSAELAGVCVLANNMLKGLKEVSLTSYSPADLYAKYKTAVSKLTEYNESLERRKNNNAGAIVPSLDTLLNLYK